MPAIATGSMNTTQEVVVSVSGVDASSQPTTNFPAPSYGFIDDFFVNQSSGNGVVTLAPQPDGTCIVRAVAPGSQNIRVSSAGYPNMDITVTVTAAQNPAASLTVTISAPRAKTA